MSWLAALPAGILTVLWLVGPGLAGTYAIGLRGVAAWGCAPVVSVAAVAVSAALAFALGALAVRLMIRRSGRSPEPIRYDGIGSPSPRSSG